jgi:hypothetical protein
MEVEAMKTSSESDSVDCGDARDCPTEPNGVLILTSVF